MLLHAAVNNSKDIVPSAVPGATNPFGMNASVVGWLTVAGLWIGAAYFLFRMSKAKLALDASRQEVKTEWPNRHVSN
jgi:hypothetical protein